MQFIKILGISLFTLALFFLAAPSARASEGTVELQGTTGQNSRCFTTSILMSNFNFSLVVSCRELIYPPAADMFSYVLWATSLKDAKPIKLGELGVGKAQFQTNSAFSSLFVTKERNGGVREPSDALVMQGAVKPIDLLEGPARPAPEVPSISPTPTPKVATGASELGARIRRAALIFFIALFILIIGVIAIITTLRRFRE